MQSLNQEEYLHNMVSLRFPTGMSTMFPQQKKQIRKLRGEYTDWVLSTRKSIDFVELENKLRYYKRQMEDLVGKTNYENALDLLWQFNGTTMTVVHECTVS